MVMEEAIKLNELTSRREKLKVISLLGQEIIKDTVQINKDRAENFLKSATSLIDKKKEQAKSKWRSFKENIAKRIENINKKINDTKKFLRVNAKLGVRKIRQVPKEAAKGMANLGKSVAKVGLQGAGLVVGGVVLGAQKASQFASDVKQGALDAALVASVGASLLSKKLEKEVAQVKADIAKGFVDGAQSVVLGGRNLANSVAQGYGDLKKGTKDTLVAMGEDIRNSNLVKEVKKGIEKSNENFMKGYNAALIGGGRG
jgi:hypothetical protein